MLKRFGIVLCFFIFSVFLCVGAKSCPDFMDGSKNDRLIHYDVYFEDELNGACEFKEAEKALAYFFVVETLFSEKKEQFKGIQNEEYKKVEELEKALLWLSMRVKSGFNSSSKNNDMVDPFDLTTAPCSGGSLAGLPCFLNKNSALENKMRGLFFAKNADIEKLKEIKASDFKRIKTHNISMEDFAKAKKGLREFLVTNYYDFMGKSCPNTGNSVDKNCKTQCCSLVESNKQLNCKINDIEKVSLENFKKAVRTLEMWNIVLVEDHKAKAGSSITQIET